MMKILSLAPLKVLFGLFFTAVLMSSCVQEDDSLFDAYKCVNEGQLPLNSGKEVVAIGRVQQALFTDVSWLWTRSPLSEKNKDGELVRSKKIPICWEPATFWPDDQPYRDLVKEAVLGTWQKALDFPPGQDVAKKFEFVGFEKCKPIGEEGSKGFVRILVQDKRPHCAGLGTQLLDRYGAVVLNFSFQNWSSNCSKIKYSGALQSCIRQTAIHEFGHVLGFTHEQNRPDKDQAACEDVPDGSGSIGNLMVGPWDLNSIMNYCNPDKSASGQLSPGDILGARALYYSEYFDFKCLEKSLAFKTAKSALFLEQKKAVDSTHGLVKKLPDLAPMKAPATRLNSSQKSD